MAVSFTSITTRTARRPMAATVPRSRTSTAISTITLVPRWPALRQRRSRKATKGPVAAAALLHRRLADPRQRHDQEHLSATRRRAQDQTCRAEAHQLRHDLSGAD